MTNLVAAIIITISTNWVTVSTTHPAPCGMFGCAVYHPASDNQIGTVMSNTMAMIECLDRGTEEGATP